MNTEEEENEDDSMRTGMYHNHKRASLVLKDSEQQNFMKFDVTQRPSPWYELSRLILGVERQYVLLKRLNT